MDRPNALRRDLVNIEVDLGAGNSRTMLMASDLTEEYVKINAEYRS